MEGPRRPVAGELKEILGFLDNQLRPEIQWSLAAEYPQVFNDKNNHNIRVIRDGQNVLAHAAMNIQIVKTPAAIFKVATIGSVVTDPKHRNKGLSRDIMLSCLDNAKVQGCDFAILWTELFDFYKKLGFSLAGYEVSFVLNEDLPAKNSQWRYMDSNKVSPESLLRLYTKHRVGSIRASKDIRAYLKIPNSRVYTAWSQDNQLMAYAVEGKGADLSGYIHEWGGGTKALLSLLKYVQEQRNKSTTLITPFHSTNLIQQLESLGFKAHHGYLGMIKLLEPENIFPKIERLAASYGYENFQMKKVFTGFEIHLGQEVLNLSGEEDLTHLIFGPVPDRLLNKLNPDNQEKISQLFPLPLWIWGWDSV